MDRNALDPEALIVESFDVGSDGLLLQIGNQLDCTGCDSGCGIFPNDP